VFTFRKNIKKNNQKSKKNLPTAASILKTMDHNQVIYMLHFLENWLAKNGNNNWKFSEKIGKCEYVKNTLCKWLGYRVYIFTCEKWYFNRNFVSFFINFFVSTIFWTFGCPNITFFFTSWKSAHFTQFVNQTRVDNQNFCAKIFSTF